MRLVQLNCWSGKLGTQIKRFEEKTNPDIVCLQEDFLLRKRLGSVFASSNELFPAARYPHRAFGKTFGLRYMKELADFGNTVVSKFPIKATNVIYTTKNTQPVADLEVLDGDDYNVRNFVHTEMSHHNKIFHVITHHGYRDPKSKNGNEENTRQMRVIADYIDTLTGPVILTGDFNLEPSSKSLLPLARRLRNLCTEFSVDSTRNIMAKRQEVIDYIFVSEDVKVVDFTVSEELLSDHKALLLDFTLYN